MISNSFLRAMGAICLCGLLAACSTTGASGLSTQVATDATTTSAPAELLSALEGGLVGRAQGERLSRSDRQLALQNEYRALEYTAPGEAVLWQGKSINGRIVPSQPYRVGSQDCRQYEHTITDLSAEATVRGTACRNENGSWTLLS